MKRWWVALLVMSCASGAELTRPAGGAKPTFNRDVAPILYAHCTQCHRAGEVAPFELITYQDAKKRAPQLVQVTKSRYMPPWAPEPGGAEFQHERRLTAAQIATIEAWWKGGAPEGAPKDKPAVPTFTNGWQGQQPDMVIKVAQPYAVRAEGGDDFRCFVIPSGFEETKYIKAVEFRPENRKVVHHALVFADTTGTARKLEKVPGEGYPCFGGAGFPGPILAAWAPGFPPTVHEPGYAFTVRKGADLVLQLHYHPSGKPEMDQSQFGMVFTDKPVHQTSGVIMGTKLVDIPAGEKNYVVKDSVVLPEEALVSQVVPHAHWLGKSMKLIATKPDGQTVALMVIKDWDFNWQGIYDYKTPVRLPKGTRLDMEWVYDNSDDNPRNPSKPAKRVTWGEESLNEMSIAAVTVKFDDDEKAIPFGLHMFTQRVVKLVKEEGNPLGQDTLAVPRYKQLLAAFDKDKDGALSEQEQAAAYVFLVKMREQQLKQQETKPAGRD